MKIGLIGYGRMGKEVEKLAISDGHTIEWIVDVLQNKSAEDLDERSVQAVDVCIEFTEPGSALGNIVHVLKHGGKVICGTTGWHHELEYLRSAATWESEAVVYGSNFSIGIFLFKHLVRMAAKLFNTVPELYDVAVHEIHHRGKADHPSGTARDLGAILLEEHDGKAKQVSELSPGKIDPNSLHVSYSRIGSVPGSHIIYFDSDFDTVELRHSARSRTGFARGAILAAEWIEDKTGMFSFQEVMTSILEEKT